MSFKNVSFSYPETKGRPVISDLTLDIKSGESVAILGATGSGKSSLVNLIPRFYDCTAGEVLVDGVNVKDCKLDELRKKVGIVLQKSELFSGTVEDNIMRRSSPPHRQPRLTSSFRRYLQAMRVL